MTAYISPEYVYSFLSGPDIVQSKEDAWEIGINCISLAHLALKDLYDYELPRELMCAELYADREHFIPLEDGEAMMVGDLVWFGIEDPEVQVHEFVPHYENGSLINWADFPVKHVAIFTGEYADGDPLLLHSTSIVGTNVVWPLSYFKTYRRYRQLYGVTRLIGAAEISS